ncbi:MAG: PorT family protein [Sphingobacteriales bacterium]|nr:MAG: PorT family protein [Sphingobacteriales bacterium]
MVNRHNLVFKNSSKVFAALRATILAAVVLVLFPLSSNGQSSWYEEEPSRIFHGGLVAGGNFTQVDGDNYAGYGKTGLNAGAIVFTHFTGSAAASLEILYAQKGARASHAKRSLGNGNYIIESYRIGLNYAEVPILLHYYDKRKNYFGAGMSYSQLINNTEEATTTPGLPNNVDLEKQYPFKKYDLNFIIGANVKVYKGLYLNARFAYSVIPVRKNENVNPILGRAEQYNNIVTLRLMYLFNK